MMSSDDWDRTPWCHICISVTGWILMPIVFSLAIIAIINHNYVKNLPEYTCDTTRGIITQQHRYPCIVSINNVTIKHNIQVTLHYPPPPAWLHFKMCRGIRHLAETIKKQDQFLCFYDKTNNIVYKNPIYIGGWIAGLIIISLCIWTCIILGICSCVTIIKQEITKKQIKKINSAKQKLEITKIFVSNDMTNYSDTGML